jgi:hypothetical protein
MLMSQRSISLPIRIPVALSLRMLGSSVNMKKDLLSVTRASLALLDTSGPWKRPGRTS